MELKIGKILVYDNTCHKCQRKFKAPRIKFHTCGECMSSGSPLHEVLMEYDKIAKDREALKSQVKKLKEILSLFYK